MRNLKTLADGIKKLNDESFESFIAEQILTSKSGFDEEPKFSIIHSSMIIDVWKKRANYELVKSSVLGAKKAGKDFRKIMKKEDIIKEISRLLNDFLD